MNRNLHREIGLVKKYELSLDCQNNLKHYRTANEKGRVNFNGVIKNFFRFSDIGGEGRILDFSSFNKPHFLVFTKPLPLSPPIYNMLYKQEELSEVDFIILRMAKVYSHT